LLFRRDGEARRNELHRASDVGARLLAETQRQTPPNATSCATYRSTIRSYAAPPRLRDLTTAARAVPASTPLRIVADSLPDAADLTRRSAETRGLSRDPERPNTEPRLTNPLREFHLIPR